jgi:uncharacterized protein YjbI with pentapeptide repeats
MFNYPDFSSCGYQIERELGKNSAVDRFTYKATQITTLTPVVIKEFRFTHLDSSRKEYDAHLSEINLLKRLDHPSIPKYIDFFETSSGFCLVQEYKNGLTLARSRYFTPNEVKEIALAILEILVYLQQQEIPIIHRNIKPENILVERGKELKVYLVDFDFATRCGDVAVSSVVKGTLGFMPPEQIFNRQLTETSDLYSLGVTLVCLLTKIEPTQISKSFDQKYQVDLSSLSSQFNPQLIDWLKKMTALNCKNRFPNATKALAELRPIDFAPNPGRSRLKKMIRSPRIITVVGLTSLGIIATSGVITHLIHKQNFKIASSKNVVKQLLETRECPKCELQNTYLKGYNLQNVNLKDANLKGANLENANLKGANLENAKLWGANLKNANLQGTKFIDANLESANLIKANLGSANLNDANLRFVQLQGANLENANLQGSRLWEADLTQANLNKANLAAVNFGHANLSYASMQSVDLNSANLWGTKLWNANLENANLVYANLQGAKLKGAIMPDGSKHD